MKVYLCRDHDVRWPVCSPASIVVAASEAEAKVLLHAKLAAVNLDGDFTLQELDLTKPWAEVLNDGDY